MVFDILTTYDSVDDMVNDITNNLPTNTLQNQFETNRINNYINTINKINEDKMIEYLNTIDNHICNNDITQQQIEIIEEEYFEKNNVLLKSIFIANIVVCVLTVLYCVNKK